MLCNIVHCNVEGEVKQNKIATVAPELDTNCCGGLHLYVYAPRLWIWIHFHYKIKMPWKKVSGEEPARLVDIWICFFFCQTQPKCCPGFRRGEDNPESFFPSKCYACISTSDWDRTFLESKIQNKLGCSMLPALHLLDATFEDVRLVPILVKVGPHFCLFHQLSVFLVKIGEKRQNMRGDSSEIIFALFVGEIKK